MKKGIYTVIATLAIACFVSNDLFARGGRGGGRSGGGGGAMRGGGGGGGGGRAAAMHRGGGGASRGGGAARPSLSHTPAATRPSVSRPTSRPSTGRPSAGGRPGSASGPSLGTNRPATGNRPSLGTQRPGGTLPGARPERPPTGNRPNLPNRPSTPAGGRPSSGSRGRPSAGDLDRFLDLQGRPGRGPSQRPSTRPGSIAGAVAGGALAGGAAAEFLRDRPTQGSPDFSGRPGAGQRPSTLPARPGDLTRPTRPGRPGDGDRPGRPGTGDRPGRPGDGIVDRPDRPGTGDRPGRPGEGDRPGRPGAGDRPGRPGDGIVDRPGRPGDGDFADHRPDRIPDRNRWNSWRQNNWTQVNNYWNNSWNIHRNWYGSNWWNRYPHVRYHYYHPGFDCWRWATWGAVNSWFPWGWSQPVYYNYGDNVYYEGDTVYYGTEPVASVQEYAQQAEQIATSIPNVEPAEDSWMPLGVFAVTPDGQPTGAEPTMYLQLAVSKEGILAGTFQNTATDSVQSVEGMVDKESQRAAWTVAGETRPLMETGIVNLTQDTAPALVHFADGTTQQWLLVRLDEPKDGPTDG